VRHQGVFAPNSPWRVALVPLSAVQQGRPCVTVPAPPTTTRPGEAKAGTPGGEPTDGDGGQGRGMKGSARIEWARLLWRVWGVDALECPGCGGRMRMIAAITERVGIVRILDHLNVSTEVPRMRRSRDGP